MPTGQIDTLAWRKPWEGIPQNERDTVAAELRREIVNDHVLHGVTVTAFGHRIDCDDFVFIMGDVSSRVAVVHLTWRVETTADWPHVIIFDSLDEWREECMLPDAQEYLA